MIRTVPIIRKKAFLFIKEQHRHHSPPQGSIFQIAASDGEKVIGVAVVGRPVGRRNQDGFTAEVTRLCTDGTKNACSLLYSACARIVREMGYKKIITFILVTEPGISLKASGWNSLGVRRGGHWSVKSRPRQTTAPTCKKIKYEKRFE